MQDSELPGRSTMTAGELLEDRGLSIDLRLVGGGVAIPHGSIDRLDRQIGAVLLCPNGIDFDAIDNAPVVILFAVIGPKRATGEHLKTLARVSRLLRDQGFRDRLLTASSGHAAYALLAAEDGRAVAP